MGKSVGFIGNFKGKLGNAVGYKVSQSNSGTNQGVRVYQPNIKNPKSAAQAEQRAKYAPIFATYRALKMIIDRGNESKPYGNASRIAWLRKAFKAEIIPWFEKGANISVGVPCQVSTGSLVPVSYVNNNGILQINCASMKPGTELATIGALSTALKADYPSLQDGDQITTVILREKEGTLYPEIFSFIIDTTSATPQTLYEAGQSIIEIDHDSEKVLFAVIVSREGANGKHLRSTADLRGYAVMFAEAPFDDSSKKEAIASYMSSASANSDWAEESIQ